MDVLVALQKIMAGIGLQLVLNQICLQSNMSLRAGDI